jgi:translation initiation factor 3 subunit F
MTVEDALLQTSPLNFPTATVYISPAVPITILDHYTRRPKDAVRVVGVLLGKKDEGKIQIYDCYPIPLTETEDSIDLDLDYIKVMNDLQSKIDSSLSMMGWYATGSTLDDTISQIHSYFKRENLFLLTDASLETDKITMKAYTTSPIAFDPTGLFFTELSVVVKAFNFIEKQCLDVLKNSIDEPKPIPKGNELLKLNIDNLLSMLTKLGGTVERAGKEEAQMDPDVTNSLIDALSNLTKSHDIEKATEQQIKDMINVMHLVKLTEEALKKGEEASSQVF